MSNATTEPEVKVPPKIYRFLLKGLHFIENCTFDDLVSYVYLKNKRQFRIDQVEKLVREASDRFVAQGLLKCSGSGTFRFHEQYLSGEPTTVGLDDPDRDERLTVDPAKRKPVPATGSEPELPPVKRFRNRQGKKTALPKARKHSREGQIDGLDFGLVPVLEPLEFSNELEEEPGPSEMRVVEEPISKNQNGSNPKGSVLFFESDDSDSD